MSPYATYPSLLDRTVLITGGATGIGAAFVTAFARQGAKVAFLDIDTDGAATLRGKLDDTRHIPLFLHSDVTDLESLATAIATASTRIGPIAVLINNAANDERHSFETTTAPEFEHNVDLRRFFVATQAVSLGSMVTVSIQLRRTSAGGW